MTYYSLGDVLSQEPEYKKLKERVEKLEEDLTKVNKSINQLKGMVFKKSKSK
jgi:hypothetical protein